MILIADSGSTKTDWALIENGKPTFFKSSGINPYFMNGDAIEKMLQIELPNLQQKSIAEIYFYGAGCTPGEKSEVVKTALKNYFDSQKIEVESDLLGAAKGLLNNEAGLIAILGTGSNTGFYDGEKIIYQVPSLGYLLGDEGSGAYIGKKLLTYYLRNQLAKPIHDVLSTYFKAEKIDNPITYLYSHPFPNKWLANLLTVVQDFFDYNFFKPIVSECFTDLLGNVISNYPNYETYKVNAVGSIAFYFAPILESMVDEYGLKMGKIAQSPIAGLVDYFLAKKSME